MQIIPAPVSPEKNYSSFSEFENLKSSHKAIVVVVSIFVCLLTLGIAVPFAIPALIGRLRKLEMKEGSDQAQTAAKVNDVANNIHQADKDAAPVEDNNESTESELDEIPPEVLAYHMEEMEEAEKEKIKEKILDAFSADYPIVVKMIEEAAIKEGSLQKVTEYMIRDEYLKYKKEKEKNFYIADENIPLLLDELKRILDDKKDPDPIEFPYKLESKDKVIEEEVITHKTIGDGSCGFHALLGELKENGYYSCNAEEERKKFCDYLEKVFEEAKKDKEKRLPEAIDNLLDDYFLNPDEVQKDEAPKEFFNTIVRTRKGSKRIIELLKDYKPDHYNNLSPADQEKRKHDFKYKPIVFKAYLNILRKKSTYLSQPELMTVAEYFNKRVRLFQRGWFKNDKDKLTQHTLNENGQEEVCIYYKARKKHYERAEVRTIVKKESSSGTA